MVSPADRKVGQVAAILYSGVWGAMERILEDSHVRSLAPGMPFREGSPWSVKSAFRKQRFVAQRHCRFNLHPRPRRQQNRRNRQRVIGTRLVEQCSQYMVSVRLCPVVAAQYNPIPPFAEVQSFRLSGHGSDMISAVLLRRSRTFEIVPYPDASFSRMTE